MSADLPEGFKSLFILNSQLNDNSTRQINNLPMCRTSGGQNSIRYWGVKSWNTFLYFLQDFLSFSRSKMCLRNASTSERLEVNSELTWFCYIVHRLNVLFDCLFIFRLSVFVCHFHLDCFFFFIISDSIY